MSIALSKIYFQLTLITFSLLLLGSSFSSNDPENQNSTTFSLDLDDNDSLALNSTLQRNKSESIYSPFGSVHTLEKFTYWAAKEEEIYRLLVLRRDAIRHEIELIRTYIADYKATSGKALPLANGTLESTSMERAQLIGASAHCMTDRYATLMPDLRKHLKSHEYQDNLRNVSEELEIQGDFNFTGDWPNRKDLFVSLASIIGLQHFYSIEADTIFQGFTYDTNFGAFLNASHCALLGTFAMQFKHYVWSVEWLEFTLAYIEKEFRGKDESISPTLVKRLLRLAIQTHNSKRETVKRTGQLSAKNLQFFTYPAYLDQDWSTRWHVRTYVTNTMGKQYGNGTAAYINMLNLCMGNDFQPGSIKARLFCYMDKKRHPYFILNPLKTEQLSEYPYIVQFYDVLGNDTINELYDQRGELRMSTVVSVAKSNVEESVAIRSSVGSSPRREFIYKIQNRSEILTGLLLTDKFEGIQTAEYTYGRFYKVHTDALSDHPDRKKEDRSREVDWSIEKYGDRVATLLYYLDVPTDGGDTAFSEVGIVARPVRGSAIFWLNLFRNGTPRADVSHAACPVIHGHKTIINQWIRYHSNFQTFKCSPHQLE